MQHVFCFLPQQGIIMMTAAEVIQMMADQQLTELPQALIEQLSPGDIGNVLEYLEQMQAEKRCGKLHHQEQLEKLRGEIPANFDQVGAPRLLASVGDVCPGARSIRGDGNCYYRAIMYRLLEQIILIDDPAAKASVLEGLIGRVRQALNRINTGILDTYLERTVEGNPMTFDKDFYVGKLQRVIEKLDKGLIWNSVENFLEDMRGENSRTDSELVQTARILTAISLLDVPDLPEGIVSETDILNIIMMSQYAEGAAVESSVLPKFLGIDCVIKNRGMRDIIGDAPERDKLDNARPFKVILKLGDQHYDLLYTLDEYQVLPDAAMSGRPAEEIAVVANLAASSLQAPVQPALANPESNSGVVGKGNPVTVLPVVSLDSTNAGHSYKRNLFFAASGLAGLGVVEYGIYAAMIAKNVVLSSVSVMIAFAGPLLIAALVAITYLLIKHYQSDTPPSPMLCSK